MPHYDEFGVLHGGLDNTPIPDKQLWMIEKVNPNQTLANNAEAFHRTLFTNGNHITSTVNTYYIIGKNVNTVHKLLYNVTLYNQWSAKATTKNGDGTVETFSASLGGKYSAKTYSYDYTHMELAGTAQKTETVDKIISLISA